VLLLVFWGVVKRVGGSPALETADGRFDQAKLVFCSVKLRFAKAGEVEVKMPVNAMGNPGAMKH